MILYNVESIFAPVDYIDACFAIGEFTTTGIGVKLGMEYVAIAATGFATALSFTKFSQTSLHVGGGGGFQQLGGFGLREFVKALRSGPPPNPNEVREKYKNALVSMGVNRDGPRKIHFRGDQKMLLDFSASLERVDIVGLSGIRIKRARITGPAIQS